MLFPPSPQGFSPQDVGEIGGKREGSSFSHELKHVAIHQKKLEHRVLHSFISKFVVVFCSISSDLLQISEFSIFNHSVLHATSGNSSYKIFLKYQKHY